MPHHSIYTAQCTPVQAGGQGQGTADAQSFLSILVEWAWEWECAAGSRRTTSLINEPGEGRALSSNGAAPRAPRHQMVRHAAMLQQPS